jgi:hypothetical protein
MTNQITIQSISSQNPEKLTISLRAVEAVDLSKNGAFAIYNKIGGFFPSFEYTTNVNPINAPLKTFQPRAMIPHLILISTPQGNYQQAIGCIVLVPAVPGKYSSVALIAPEGRERIQVGIEAEGFDVLTCLSWERQPWITDPSCGIIKALNGIENHKLINPNYRAAALLLAEKRVTTTIITNLKPLSASPREDEVEEEAPAAKNGELPPALWGQGTPIFIEDIPDHPALKLSLPKFEFQSEIGGLALIKKKTGKGKDALFFPVSLMEVADKIKPEDGKVLADFLKQQVKQMRGLADATEMLAALLETK